MMWLANKHGRGWCCLLSWHASHTRLTCFDSKSEIRTTTPFVCIAWSRWRLMWPILLCHNLIFISASRLLTYIADYPLSKSRINIQPSLLPLAMNRPFSIKLPSLLKWTCMPSSTIETKFFIMVGTCKTLWMQMFLSFFCKGKSLMCWMGCVVSSLLST